MLTVAAAAVERHAARTKALLPWAAAAPLLVKVSEGLAVLEGLEGLEVLHQDLEVGKGA